MTQVFSARAELGWKLIVMAVFAAVVAGTAAGVAFYWYQWDVNTVVGQPIPFSHKHHVGDVGLDCRMCHATADSNASPGMPTAQVCLGCHSQLFADQPMFEGLHESVRTGRPIQWARVNSLPDYVYFDHSVHVAKGVACVECHGRVDQMPLMWRVHSLQMRWCLSCHEDPMPHLSDPAKAFEMPPSPATPKEAAALFLHLEPRDRRIDCSTCHR